MAIEFSRDITFGQYLNLGSPVHRLDPRIKMLAAGALMFAVLTARLFIALAPIAIAVVLIQLLSRIPISYTLRGMRLLFFTVMIFLVFQVLFYPAQQAYWRWGVLSISWEGLTQGFFLLLRVLLLYYITSTLMFTTSLVDLADGTEIMLDPLKRIGIPVNEMVLTLIVALKFVPLLVIELERMVKAQAARGLAFDQGGPIQRARLLGGLLVPLFVNALSRAEVLATAMNARCYRGGKGRTKRRVLQLRPIDMLGLVVILALAGASIAL